PGAIPAGYAAVCVVLRRPLAEVPDIAVAGLGIPVKGVLLNPTVLDQGVLDLDAANARDDLRPVRHLDDVGSRMSVLLSAVHEGGARLQREPRVVDDLDELTGRGTRWVRRPGAHRARPEGSQRQRYGPPTANSIQRHEAPPVRFRPASTESQHCRP